MVGRAGARRVFDDNEARRAVLDLRSKTDNLASQLSAAQRTILDQSGRLDQLNQQVATLRGENEDLTNRLTTLERQQKEYYQDLDTRLKKFEPQQATIDGVEGTVQPGETDALSAAQQQFRNGNFKAAAASFRAFIAKYPQSPYQPTAQYWYGNAQYALRDYRGSTATWQGIVSKFPQHPRAADALGNRHEPARTRPEGGPRRRSSRSCRSTPGRTQRRPRRASSRRSNNYRGGLLTAWQPVAIIFCSLGRCPSC